MILSRTFRKLAKIAAVSAAMLPSLVQAFIPSASDHIGTIRGLGNARTGEIVAEFEEIGSTGGLTAHYGYSSGVSFATNLVLSTPGGVELIRSVAWDYAHLRPLDIAYRVDGSNVASYAYSYVTNDNRISRMTAADGSWWNYAYDSRGRLNAASRHFSDGTNYPGRLFAYTYDRFGNTIQAGPAPDGATPRYVFEAGGLYNVHTDRQWGSVIDVSGTVATNAKVVVNNVLANRHRDWFNATIPVANQNGPVEQTLHAYAAIPNYSAGLDLAIAKTGTVSVAKAQENPTYNAKGEPTADSRFRYVFNAFGWLTSVTNLVSEPASYVAFAYDTGGRRVRKSVYERNGSVWVEKTRNQFYYDGWNLMAETVTDKTATPESTTLRLYTWGLDLAGHRGGRLGQSAGGIGGLLAVTEIAGSITNVYYPVSDHIGTIRALVDAKSGETVAEYEYDPYGVLLEEAGEKASSCPFRFSSKYYDRETQLLYFGYRYYSPASTKWLTVDPLQERGGLNFTAYCGGDPVNQVDPLGMEPGDWLGDMGPAPMVSGSMDFRFAPPGAWSRKDPYVQRMAAVAEITEQRAHDFLAYTKNSRDFVVKGEYYEGDVNIAGISGAIGMGLLGVDLPADMRDVYHNFTHWQWSWSHAGKTSLNAIGVLPVVGVVKNLKHADHLSALKHADRAFPLRMLTRRATVNPDASTVILGRWSEFGRSYEKVADANSATYFQLDDYHELKNVWGTEKMWDINRQFLDDQWAAGKEILFSHNPWLSDDTGTFSKEVLYLMELEAKDFVDAGNGLWKVVR